MPCLLRCAGLGWAVLRVIDRANRIALPLAKKGNFEKYIIIVILRAEANKVLMWFVCRGAVAFGAITSIDTWAMGGIYKTNIDSRFINTRTYRTCSRMCELAVFVRASVRVCTTVKEWMECFILMFRFYAVDVSSIHNTQISGAGCRGGFKQSKSSQTHTFFSSSSLCCCCCCFSSSCLSRRSQSISITRPMLSRLSSPHPTTSWCVHCVCFCGIPIAPSSLFFHSLGPLFFVPFQLLTVVLLLLLFISLLLCCAWPWARDFIITMRCDI